jgi:galactokinase
MNKLYERDAWRESITDADALAEYLSCVENGFSFGELAGDRGVGTLSGSEDHTAITRSEAGRLVRYSFTPVQQSGAVALPDGYLFVVGTSGVAAEKSGAAQAAYNGLATLAADALRKWNASTGRQDETLADALETIDALDQMKELLSAEQYARVEQFHAESKILIPAAVQALERKDLVTLGNVVDHSQKLAERALGNQIPETISLAQTARDLGAVAASAFGAGWGGSVWALLPSGDALEMMEDWKQLYSQRFPQREGTFFVTRAASAARRVL